ncbi:hypothetical protein [Polymorphobacter sp.]|uniref:hypothetical protein n=1 Tax=Polymorphobacter sp. TaxID=1909290 RepID=UPI003F726A69
MKRLTPLILAGLLSGCAASPLYVERSELRGTYAEVPRDARGEPLWAAIKPAPADALYARRQARAQGELASLPR